MTTSDSPREYHVGTLRYTSAGIVSLMIWLLWGDFCLYLMEAVIPNILPLKLKSLGASGTFITALTATVPGIIALTCNPVISTCSDRYRSRWGRRIPFMLAGTPLITLILIALGWSDNIGTIFARLLPSSMAPATVTMGVIFFLMMGYYVVNIMVQNLYFALFNDVVPVQWLGRFAVLFRVAATTSTAAFHFFLFPLAATHMREIFTGAAVVYAVAYVVMCLKVKEGEYPPPPPKTVSTGGTLAPFKSYFRECFGYRYYWYWYLNAGFVGVAVLMNPFILLMTLSLGVSMKELGWINGSSALISIPVFFLTGWLMEHFNLLRFYFWMKVLHTLAFAGFTIFLFFDIPKQWTLGIVLGLNVFLLCVTAVLLVVYIPMGMRLIPRLYYAQIGSAVSALQGIMTIIGGILAGLFMDGMRYLCKGSDFSYRFAPVWATVFMGLSTYCFYKVYREVLTSHGEDLSTFEPPSPVAVSVQNTGG